MPSESSPTHLAGPVNRALLTSVRALCFFIDSSSQDENTKGDAVEGMTFHDGKTLCPTALSESVVNSWPTGLYLAIRQAISRVFRQSTRNQQSSSRRNWLLR